MGAAQIQAGVGITYRLRPSDLSTNPQGLWHGRVENVYPGTCWVCSVEPGYEGLDEMIFFEQIVGIEGGIGYELSPQMTTGPRNSYPRNHL